MCTFENVPNGCNVKFETTSKGRRIYVYNVNIMDMNDTGKTSMTFEGLTNTSYTIGDIDADMYYYRVRAICDDGYSDWSEWMTVDIAAPVGGLLRNNDIKREIYDLFGRRLHRIPQSGVYIQAGKVHIVR